MPNPNPTGSHGMRRPGATSAAAQRRSTTESGPNPGSGRSHGAAAVPAPGHVPACPRALCRSTMGVPATAGEAYSTAIALGSSCSRFGGNTLENRERVRFEVAGGNYRLVAAFDFRRQIAFVKFIGTHAEYDRIDALTVSEF